jgi:hypothetical protein
MSRHGAFLGLAWLGAIGAVAVVGAIFVGGATAKPKKCSKPYKVPAGRVPGSLQLQAHDGGVAIHFDDSRAQDVDPVPLKVFGDALTSADFRSPEGLNLQLGDSYVRRDRDHWIALDREDGFVVNLIPTDAYALELCAIVNPKAIGSLKPGRYRGTIRILQGSEQTQLATLGVEFTFRAARWTGIEIVIVAVLLGLAVKVLSDAAATQRKEDLGPLQALKKTTVSDLGFVAAIILAAVGAWLVFEETYSSNQVWGASGGDIPKLFVVCFLEQLSSNQGIDVIKRVSGKFGNGSSK